MSSYAAWGHGLQVDIYIHVCVYMYVYTYMHALSRCIGVLATGRHVYTYNHMCKYIFIWEYICICPYICMGIRRTCPVTLHWGMSYRWTCINMYMCICLYIFIWLYIHMCPVSQCDQSALGCIGLWATARHV